MGHSQNASAFLYSRVMNGPGSPTLDKIPALVVGPRRALFVTSTGEAEDMSHAAARRKLGRDGALVCNQAVVARRIGLTAPRLYDVLELFLFTRPASPVLPTAGGMATALGLDYATGDLGAEAALLHRAAGLLLDELARPDYPGFEGASAVARDMVMAGWPWGPLVMDALAQKDSSGTSQKNRIREVWDALPEWEDDAPTPPPGTAPVTPEEAEERLRNVLGAGAEDRPAQFTYSRAAAEAFAPPNRERAPRVVLAEAGTGTGKTLGYVAPASLWAEKNGGTVWLSTYTKNLQRQLDQEIARLFPDPAERIRRAVIRKGRENYLCLLNLQERSGRIASPVDAILMGLVKRWARFTRDGDMVGGDFPAWLASFYGPGRVASLTDRRGECIYAACAHYRRCFIERAVRKSRRADLVVANHALVMVQAVTRAGEREAPRRIVFDEGHHLFDAADSAFAVALSGGEAMELRRWLRGAETSGSRARGLRARIGDLLVDDDDADKRLREVLHAARALPADGWLKRIQSGDPYGPAEKFLYLLREQVRARAERAQDLHGLEVPANDPVPGLVEAATELDFALEDLVRPLGALARGLMKRLDGDAQDLDTATRNRIESLARSITRRRDVVAGGWREMLKAVGDPPSEIFVDWFALSRAQGREMDVGMHRHWIDPTQPLAEAVIEPADGVLITSATLGDRGTADAADDWHSAEIRTGAGHMVVPPARLSLASPFDYAARTRIFVVTDVSKRDPDQVAAAYRELFMAAGGGGLGIFTAIARLRAVFERIEPMLHDAGLPLYAQHVMPMDTGTLVDIFRAEEHSSLLGTDAVRDGVDVPGRALRLIVFDRVPWPRPTILHRVRRTAFGAREYDDMLTRLRLKQAFGRLVRRADDTGVFVMLDSATPSRLLSAFPPDVTVARVGLAEAIAETRTFLAKVQTETP